MPRIEYLIKPELLPFVNCIMADQSNNAHGHLNMPMHADGYPGIMFQQSEYGFYLLPAKKKLSDLFLYGQTIKPISLDVKGRFDFIVFQLYPFASKYLLNVDPKNLNDDCYDLTRLMEIQKAGYHLKLLEATTTEARVEILSDMISRLIAENKLVINDRIQDAVHQIIASQGIIEINLLRTAMHITERTFERNFLSETGLTPKQFAKIIRFQYSLQQLTRENFDSLTEIGFDSGFADQSHFIREFKRYTGQTPSYYLEQITAG